MTPIEFPPSNTSKPEVKVAEVPPSLSEQISQLEAWAANPTNNHEQLDQLFLVASKLRAYLTQLESIVHENAKDEKTASRSGAVDQYKVLSSQFTRVQKVFSDVSRFVHGDQAPFTKELRFQFDHINPNFNNLEQSLEIATRSPYGPADHLINESERPPSLLEEEISLQELIESISRGSMAEIPGEFLSKLDEIFAQLNDRAAFVLDSAYRNTDFSKIAQAIVNSFEYADNVISLLNTKVVAADEKTGTKILDIQRLIQMKSKEVDEYLAKNRSMPEVVRRNFAKLFRSRHG